MHVWNKPTARETIGSFSLVVSVANWNGHKKLMCDCWTPVQPHMKLKFTLELWVCSDVRPCEAKRSLCFWGFKLWMILFPLTSSLSHVLFFLCFSPLAHTCLCVCVSLCVHDPPLPGWMLCNHSSVRSLWGTTVGAFFITTSRLLVSVSSSSVFSKVLIW